MTVKLALRFVEPGGTIGCQTSRTEERKECVGQCQAIAPPVLSVAEIEPGSQI